MCIFENNFILNKFNKIRHHFRCVDDGLLFIEGDQHEAHNLLEFIDKIHDKMKFKLQIGNDNKLNYHDL